MNPAAHDSLAWLTELGLVVVEEQVDGSALCSSNDGTRLIAEFTQALVELVGEEAGLALETEARATGRGVLDLGHAKVVIGVREGLLTATLLPFDRRAASVVHELANSLTGIAGWAQLAANDAAHVAGLPERTVTSLDVLARATADALETARTLLASLRAAPDLAAGCDVADVVGASLATLRTLTDDKDIAVRSRLPKGVHARMRSAELRSIATNLIKNAIEAVQRGGEIVVSVESSATLVTLAVVDDGPGLDPSMAKTLFEPWRSTKTGGTGLGLALVRDLARSRGGDVTAESGPRRGARFVVRIPRAIASTETGTDTATSGSVIPARHSGVRRRNPARTARRVLVIDDDESLREMVSTALELRGSQVTALSGAREAAALDQKFDVALVDLTLNDGRGDQLAAWIHDRGLASRIIVMSGTVTESLGQRCAVELLRKPFELDELLEILDEGPIRKPVKAV